MFVKDSVTGEKILLKNLRILELPFTKVYKFDQSFLLRDSEGCLIAEVSRSQLDEKTNSKLDSLSEFKP